MISNLSLAAFSPTNLRPAEPRAPGATPQPLDGVQAVRAQGEVRVPVEPVPPVGRSENATMPDRPVPRGSLLDLRV